jgi:hypothetical protein
MFLLVSTRANREALLCMAPPSRNRRATMSSRRLPVLLRLQGLRQTVATKAGRLLRVLFVRNSAVPAYPGERWAGTLMHARLTRQGISEALAVMGEPRIMRHRDMHKRDRFCTMARQEDCVGGESVHQQLPRLELFQIFRSRMRWPSAHGGIVSTAAAVR